MDIKIATFDILSSRKGFWGSPASSSIWRTSCASPCRTRKRYCDNHFNISFVFWRRLPLFMWNGSAQLLSDIQFRTGIMFRVYESQISFLDLRCMFSLISFYDVDFQPWVENINYHDKVRCTFQSTNYASGYPQLFFSHLHFSRMLFSIRLLIANIISPFLLFLCCEECEWHHYIGELALSCLAGGILWHYIKKALCRQGAHRYQENLCWSKYWDSMHYRKMWL